MKTCLLSKPKIFQSLEVKQKHLALGKSLVINKGKGIHFINQKMAEEKAISGS